jgi:hypothetical protein
MDKPDGGLTTAATGNNSSNNTPKNIQNRHVWNTQQTRPVCLQKNHTHPKTTQKFHRIFFS